MNPVNSEILRLRVNSRTRKNIGGIEQSEGMRKWEKNRFGWEGKEGEELEYEGGAQKAGVEIRVSEISEG